MVKAILKSIKPKSVGLILNGKKTILESMTAPKLETPFKVYMYCTSVKKMNLNDYVNIHRSTGGMIDDWHGKVVAEFTCNEIIDYIPTYDKGKVTDYFITRKYPRDCLTKEERMKYGKGKRFYGLHVSDLKIYDQPKELSEFSLYEKKDCDHYYRGICGITERLPKCCDYACNRKNHIYPPQSYCYVEEEE